MPDTPDAQRRRIRWIVALIVFMLALAALYMVVVDRHPGARKSVVAVNTVDPRPDPP